MYGDLNLRAFHIELTTACNASCPQCPRNYVDGTVNELLPDSELSLAFFQSAIPRGTLKELKRLDFCGNYGDPAMAKDADRIVRYVLAENPAARVTFHTNGSVRNPGWWRGLALPGVECIFALDGLSGTHEMYRRRTSWLRTTDNARAFIDAGGKATWQFIAFEHNERELEDCKKLAEEWGFHKFVVRKTNRFLGADGQVSNELFVPTLGQVRSYLLRPPTDRSLLNVQVIRKYSPTEFEEALQGSIVECKAIQERQIYISATSHVFPCCYLGHINQKGKTAADGEIVKALAKNGQTLDDIDLRKNSLENILSSNLFQTIIPESWTAADAADQLRTCKRVCGLERKSFEASASRNEFIFTSRGKIK